MANLRFFASTRAVVGSDVVAAGDFRLPANVNTDVLRTALINNYPQARNLFMTCTFLADGVRIGERTISLADHDTIDVLPPFAGG